MNSGITLIDLQITSYRDNLSYWQALMVICEWELADSIAMVRRDMKMIVGEEGEEEERGLPSCIAAEVEDLLHRKTHSELEVLQSQIESQMQSGAAKLVEFFEAVLRHLPLYKAKACLKDHIHAKMLDSAIDPTSEDEAILDNKVKEDSYEKSALESMEGGDVEVLDEFKLDSMVYPDHYCLTKPKYFNRVHIGYDWNKYNRTHYDHESPPPKMVCGYKFNIYYPDLVDKSKAPGYIVETDGDSRDTCIIKFRTGLPYQDIAFRIVNKEWDCSRKNGFKCTFERGILCCISTSNVLCTVVEDPNCKLHETICPTFSFQHQKSCINVATL